MIASVLEPVGVRLGPLIPRITRLFQDISVQELLKLILALDDLLRESLRRVEADVAVDQPGTGVVSLKPDDDIPTLAVCCGEVERVAARGVFCLQLHCGGVIGTKALS